MNTKPSSEGRPATQGAEKGENTADGGRAGDATGDGVVRGSISSEGVRADRASAVIVTSESAGNVTPLAPGPNSEESEDFESWLKDAAGVEAPSGVPLPATGQLISGKYRIVRELGRGGMGAVFEAVHEVSHKLVALKWMLRSGLDPRAKERFTREARAAGRIAHPNVVDVYDIGDEGNASYLVMELLRGESLRHRIARGPLGVEETVDLLVPAMRGVAAAHRQGVIHRDLKPDNIFACVDADGSPREAKVLDFGVSTITSADSPTQSTLTQEGSVLGTPAYMSAQQLENPRAVDVRADVHALGVIVYECLTGRLPYEATTHNALVLAIVKGDPILPRTHRPDIPEQLQAVLLKAVSKENFTSVDEFIDALVPFGDVLVPAGEVESNSRSRMSIPSAAASPGAMRSRTRLVLVVGLLSVIALILFFALRAAPPTDTPAAAAPADEPTPDLANQRAEPVAKGPAPAPVESEPVQRTPDPPAASTPPVVVPAPVAPAAAASRAQPAAAPRAQPAAGKPPALTSGATPAESATVTSPRERGDPGRSGSIAPEDF